MLYHSEIKIFERRKDRCPNENPTYSTGCVCGDA